MGRSSSYTRITPFTLVARETYTGLSLYQRFGLRMTALIFLDHRGGQPHKMPLLPLLLFVFHQFDTNEHDEYCNIQI